MWTERNLSASEAMMWRLESDPQLTSTVANVTFLDRLTPDGNGYIFENQPAPFERLQCSNDSVSYTHLTLPTSDLV